MMTLRMFLLLFSTATCSAVTAEPVLIARGEGESEPRQPQISIDDESRIFVAFGRGEEVLVCRSDDQGKTFTPQVSVSHLPKLALGRRRGPRIATSGDSLVVAAISHETGDLVAWRSVDLGESWTSGKVVNDVPQSAREGLHGIGSGPDGSVYLAWLDLRSGSTEIYLSKSSDGGASWSENIRVYRSPSGTVCECCHPSVSVGPDGQVAVMWRNVVDGDRDMYVASSETGQSFGPARKLGSGSWPLDACPMDGGDLTIGDNGTVTTVWRRKKTIYSCSPNDAFEKVLGQGEQPWITASDNGTWIVWLSRRNGELRYLGPTMEQHQRLATDASDPVVQAGGDDEIVVAAWETHAEDEAAIVAEILNGS